MNRRRAALAAVPLAAALAAGLPAVTAQASHTDSTSRLTAIRAASHTGYDRLVFEFSGGLPTSTYVNWATKVTQDGSGATVPAHGNAFLQIGMSGVTGLTSSHTPSYGATRRTYALPNLAQVVHAGEFEGMLSFGASTMAKTSYKLTKLTSPSRIVLDISSNYARTSVPVSFVDQNRVISGATPYTRTVWRTVPSGAPAGGSLHRLFAGPTAAEYATGLRFVSSGATSWADLAISSAVARVRLLGGCSSGGSTVTIADEIMPTLRAFSTVDWVKIYAPSGQTGTASGSSDSMPECLEP